MDLIDQSKYIHYLIVCSCAAVCACQPLISIIVMFMILFLIKYFKFITFAVSKKEQIMANDDYRLVYNTVLASYICFGVFTTILKFE